MAVFQITTKQLKVCNGIRIDPGLCVQIQTNDFVNPLLTIGGQSVADAFMRIYGIDIRKAGIMNQVYLDVKRII